MPATSWQGPSGRHQVRQPPTCKGTHKPIEPSSIHPEVQQASYGAFAKQSVWNCFLRHPSPWLLLIATPHATMLSYLKVSLTGD